MKYIYIFLFSTLFTCYGQVSSTSSKQEKEITYIKQRNFNVKYYKDKEINDKVGVEMSNSILSLEKLLKSILSNARIESLNENGDITVQTFFPEVGFGMLDGLGILKEDIYYVCTSRHIFNDYFKKQNKDLFNNITEVDLEEIFYCAFASNHTITSISTFKINNKKNVKAYGMISIDGQDIGPFLPNTLYGLALVDDTIYLVSKSIQNDLKPIEKCINNWNNSDMKSEDIAWKNHYKCYQKEFVVDEQFIPLKKEIEEMLKIFIE